VIASAAEAAVQPITSVSFWPSCESTLTCSWLQLDLVDEALGEQRTDRAIHHAHGEDFLLARLPLALAEAARVFAGRGELLTVVAGQREEVDAHARVCAHGGGKHDRVAVAGHDGAAGELGDLAGLEAERAPADLTFNEAGGMVSHGIDAFLGSGVVRTAPWRQRPRFARTAVASTTESP